MENTNLEKSSLEEDLTLLKTLIKKYDNLDIPIVLNKCYGGFGLSKEAYEYMGLNCDDYGSTFGSDRLNPKLIDCIKTLGEKASGSCSSLVIEYIDFDELMTLNIDNNDGFESFSKRDGYSILNHFVK